MFSHICKTYYPLFFLVVHMYPVWWGLHDTLIPLDSMYASPGPPKMKTKIGKKFHQITSSNILHIVELWCDFKMFVGPWSIYIKCLWVLLTNVYWFRATGGYICGCGRPSNLVSLLVNCSCELRQIITRYDFLWARWVILSNVRTDLNLN